MYCNSFRWIIFGLFCTLTWNVLVATDGDYRPHGPDETRDYEIALEKVSPIYTNSIWPRKKILGDSFPVEKVPKECFGDTQRWLAKVLRSDLLPKEWEVINWVAIQNFKWGLNYVLGSWKIDGKRVRVLANWQTLNILITEIDADTDTEGRNSSTLMTAKKGKLLRAVTEPLRLSDRTIEPLIISEKRKTIAGIHTIYGTVSTKEFQENRSSRNRKWWSSVTFLIRDRTLFLSVSTINWKKPPASTGDRWHFTGD